MIRTTLAAALIAAVSCNVALAKDAHKDTIVFGATVGDHADMFKAAVKPTLEKEGYKVKVIEFTDYIRPNLALAQHDLDVNEFQHKPYLDQFKQAHNLKLANVQQSPTAPMGLYAGRKSSLKDIADGDSISLPNDPSNEARALLLAQELGLIKMDKKVNPLTVSPKDIAENPHHIKFVELEAAQLPRSRQDVDFALVPGNYATSSGMALTSAIKLEHNRRYINWVVVRTSDVNKPWVKDVEAAYNAPIFKKWVHQHFKGYLLPDSWSK